MNVQYLARMIIGGSFLALYLFVALCHWGMLLDWLLTKRRVGSMVPLVGDIAGVIGALLMSGIPTWVAWALPFCDIGFLVFLAALPVDSNGIIVTDPVDMGTYNFYDPKSDPLMHTLTDVLPYMLMGNTRKDMFMYGERLKATVRGAMLKMDAKKGN